MIDYHARVLAVAYGAWDIAPFPASERAYKAGHRDARLAAAEIAAEADARVAELGRALQRIRNEVSGLRGLEEDMRYAIGNSNWECLMLRIAEADAALATAPHEPPAPEEAP